MSKSLLEMIKGRWREFVREPSAFFFVIFMPLIWMGILGSAFDGKRTDHFGIGWQVSTPAPADSLSTALAQDPRIQLTVGNEEAMNTALKRGDALLVVEPKDGALVFHYDPANREAGRARLVVEDLLQRAAGQKPVLATADVPVSVPGTRYVEFLVPGLVALSIMTSSLFGTGAVIVASRRENLLKRYLATPMRATEYIISHIVGRLLILMVELAAILTGGCLLFHVHIAGSLPLFIAVATLGAAAFTALALVCAARTANMAVLNGITNLITLPMMLVAGVWFSRSTFPDWLRTIAKLLPLTALVDALRSIALEGAGISSLGGAIAVLAAYLVVGTIGARVLFKWY